MSGVGMMKDVANAAISKALFFLSPTPRSDEVLRATSPIDVRGFPQLRIALVKQDVYTNLYCAPISSSVAEILGSSLRHTGPAALFSAFTTDFHIVRSMDDPECQIWREKISCCKQGDEAYFFSQRARKSRLSGVERWQQGALAVDPAEVDWSIYDVVISVDVAVPRRVIKQHPKPLWCYYISEPCMRSYKESFARPIEGYDLFFNQKFSTKETVAPEHVIDFPFALQYQGCFAALTGTNAEARKQIFLESHTAKQLSRAQLSRLERLGPLMTPPKDTDMIIRELARSKYFVRLGGRRLWGNSMVEAISCGALGLGQPGEYKNRSLFTRATSVLTFDSLVRRIEDFEQDDGRFALEVEAQHRLLDYYCFSRPIGRLLNALREKRPIR